MDSEHGTYAAYQQEMKTAGVSCDACRAAVRAYQKENRAKNRAANTQAYAKEKAGVAARSRALTRLAALHPVQYRALVEEERRRG